MEKNEGAQGLVITTPEALQSMIDLSVARAFEKFTPAQPKKEKYLSVKEVAAALQVAELTIYRGVKAGKIPHKMIGSKIKIAGSYLD